MDLIWTIALLVGGYFVYNWYTGLQRQVKSGPGPDPRVDGSPGRPAANAAPAAGETDYIDFEEVTEEE